MNETLLWLLYCASGGVAFAAIYYQRWRISLAVLAGGLITTIGWLLLFRFTAENKRPDWVRMDLSLDLIFGLFFAVAGAAIAWWLRGRRGPVE